MWIPGSTIMGIARIALAVLACQQKEAVEAAESDAVMPVQAVAITVDASQVEVVQNPAS